MALLTLMRSVFEGVNVKGQPLRQPNNWLLHGEEIDGCAPPSNQRKEILQLTCLTTRSSDDDLNAPFLPADLLVSLDAPASQATQPSRGEACAAALAVEEAHDNLTTRTAGAGVG